jgi:hypothetical protein
MRDESDESDVAGMPFNISLLRSALRFALYVAKCTGKSLHF